MGVARLQLTDFMFNSRNRDTLARSFSIRRDCAPNVDLPALFSHKLPILYCGIV
jgi:hypothetical protein